MYVVRYSAVLLYSLRRKCGLTVDAQLNYVFLVISGTDNN